MRESSRTCCAVDRVPSPVCSVTAKMCWMLPATSFADSASRAAVREMLPLQPGDVPDTFADVSELTKAVGYAPTTSVTDGVARLVAWYRKYYGR